jgi:voltage-gated potassium channel
MKSLEGHFIICGFVRMGHTICRQLASRHLPFVVEKSDEALGECREAAWHWVLGDATDDRVLEEAGIERARGVATVLGSDADNLYIVMSARLLRSDILILARAPTSSSLSS